MAECSLAYSKYCARKDASFSLKTPFRPSLPNSFTHTTNHLDASCKLFSVSHRDDARAKMAQVIKRETATSKKMSKFGSFEAAQTKEIIELVAVDCLFEM
ncbi:hypothetical protein [Roseobacter sp.]|uniref:hypothetical protein n=1 Tax=Roseobacter sp. TaxID=1907202 RepID=UPI00385C4F04